jgi:hypothetical protein
MLGFMNVNPTYKIGDRTNLSNMIALIPIKTIALTPTKPIAPHHYKKRSHFRTTINPTYK